MEAKNVHSSHETSPHFPVHWQWFPHFPVHQ